MNRNELKRGERGRFHGGTDVEPRVHAELERRARHRLWGRIPVEGLLSLRGMTTGGVAVYAAVCALLHEDDAPISSVLVAQLAGLGESQTRMYLRALVDRGALRASRSGPGPLLYSLGHQPAGSPSGKTDGEPGTSQTVDRRALIGVSRRFQEQTPDRPGRIFEIR